MPIKGTCARRLRRKSAGSGNPAAASMGREQDREILMSKR